MPKSLSFSYISLHLLSYSSSRKLAFSCHQQLNDLWDFGSVAVVLLGKYPDSCCQKLWESCNLRGTCTIEVTRFSIRENHLHIPIRIQMIMHITLILTKIQCRHLEGRLPRDHCDKKNKPTSVC